MKIRKCYEVKKPSLILIGAAAATLLMKEEGLQDKVSNKVAQECICCKYNGKQLCLVSFYSIITALYCCFA